jgi:hypothetical protein
MSNSDILRILSPLGLFVLHVLYLVFLSQDHFLNKWIDGSFTFFVSLVLCNVIRARLVAQTSPIDPPDDTDRGDDGPEGNGTPHVP